MCLVWPEGRVDVSIAWIISIASLHFPRKVDGRAFAKGEPDMAELILKKRVEGNKS